MQTLSSKLGSTVLIGSVICSLPAPGQSHQGIDIPTGESLYPRFSPNPINIVAMKEQRWGEAFASFEHFAKSIPPKALQSWLMLELPPEYGINTTLEQWLLNGFRSMDLASDADSKVLELIHTIFNNKSIARGIIESKTDYYFSFFGKNKIYSPGFLNYFDNNVIAAAVHPSNPFALAKSIIQVNNRYPNNLARKFRELQGSDKGEPLNYFLSKNLKKFVTLSKTNSDAKLLLRKLESILQVNYFTGLKYRKNTIPGGMVGGVRGGTYRFRNIDWSEPKAKIYPPHMPSLSSYYFPSNDKFHDYTIIVHWKISEKGKPEVVNFRSLDSRVDINYIRNTMEKWALEFEFIPGTADGVPQISDLFAIFKIQVTHGGGDMSYSPQVSFVEWIRPPSYESRWMPPPVNPWSFLQNHIN